MRVCSVTTCDISVDIGACISILMVSMKRTVSKLRCCGVYLGNVHKQMSMDKSCICPLVKTCVCV